MRNLKAISLAATLLLRALARRPPRDLGVIVLRPNPYSNCSRGCFFRTGPGASTELQWLLLENARVETQRRLFGEATRNAHLPRFGPGGQFFTLLRGVETACAGIPTSESRGYRDLLAFAARRMRGKERKAVETLCAGADAAEGLRLGFGDGVGRGKQNVEFTTDRANKKIKEHGWELHRFDNQAVLEKIALVGIP